MKLLATTLLASALLTACAPIGPATKTPNGCDWTDFIMVSKADKLSDGTADQILAHNLVRQKLCG